MKYLLLFFILISDPIYKNPDSFEKLTFKDGSKGFKLEWSLLGKEFKNKKTPELIDFYFHGPQPFHVKANSLQLISMNYGKFYIYDNLDNENIKIIAYFKDPPEKHEKKWKDYEIKVTGNYLDEESRKYRLFQRDVIKIKDVIGVSVSGEGWSKFIITIKKRCS